MASSWKLDTTKIWCRYFKHLQTKSSDKLQHITYNMECHAKKEDDQHRTTSDSNKTDGSKDYTCSGLLQAARSNPTVIFWMSIDVLTNKTSAREKSSTKDEGWNPYPFFQISKLHRLEILSLFLHIGWSNQCQKILSFWGVFWVFIHSDRVWVTRHICGWLQKMKDPFEFALHHLHTVSHVIAKPRSNTSYVYCTVDSELLAVVENVWFVAAPRARLENSRVQSGNEYRTRIQQCCDHPNC